MRYPPSAAGESQQEPEYHRRGFGGAAPIKPGAGSVFSKRTNFRSRTLRNILSGMQCELLKEKFRIRTAVNIRNGSV